MISTRLNFLSGGDRWDDRSWNNKDYADGSNREWDNGSSTSNNRYRDRSYEDDYEAEREDSDTESNHNNSYPGNNTSTTTTNTRKYRDSENNDSPTSSEKRVNLTLNAAAITKSPAKTNKPLKKVDLGAAANFGRSGTQSPTPQIGGSDLLNDDFNPRAIETNQSSPDFGDFEKAFAGGGGVETKKDDDDFADFSSAFTAGPPQQSNQQLLTSAPINLNLAPQGPLLGAPPQQPNLIGGGIQANLFAATPVAQQPPMMFASAAPPTLVSPPQVNNNVNDLLGGFSSLSVQSQAGFGPPVGNLGGSQSLLDGFESGE